MDLGAFSVKKATYTRQYLYIRGDYEIGAATVPYFSTTMKVAQAVDDLVMQRDVMLDPKKPVPFNELFQRDVDDIRVQQSLVDGYLKIRQQLKFFNALTVVLLPVGDNTVLSSYPTVSLPGAPDQDPTLKTIQVGPIQIQESPDRSIGRIAWDKDAVSAVIVDGQHRFSALKSAYNDSGFPFREGIAKSSVPVLLLVLDSRVGFRQDGVDEGSVLEASRRIFIDLNKNARTVSRSRQYLLDDRDIVAVSMRALIDENVGRDEAFVTVFDRIKAKSQVPVSAIDWQGETAKFDRSMYLSTIQTLYELTDIALGDTKISATDRANARLSIDGMISRLSIDDSEPGFGLIKELDRSEEKEEPFALTSKQVSAIAGAFRTSRGLFVTQLLADLIPYQELLREYENAGVVHGDLEQWAALDSKGRNAYIAAMGEDFKDPEIVTRQIHERVKSRYPIAFQVVFQKALVAALSDGFDLRNEMPFDLDGEDEAEPLESVFACKWIGLFNERLGAQMQIDPKKSRSFWHGSIVSPTGQISFSDSARKGLTGSLFFAILAPVDGFATEAKAEKWVSDKFKAIRKGSKTTEVDRLYSEYGSAWRQSLQTILRAELKAARKSIPDSDLLRKMTEKRAAELLMLVAAKQNYAAM